MMEEKGRFDAILAVVMANLVTDFENFGRHTFDYKTRDVSGHGGTVGVLLMGAGVSPYDLEQFVSEFKERFAVEGLSPAHRMFEQQRLAREAKSAVRANALQKLSPAEREALGLEDTDGSEDPGMHPRG